MDFFGEQRSRTRRSLLLYGLFFGFVLLHIVVALGIVTLLLTIFTDGVYYWALVLVVVWIVFSFMLGSFLEYQRLKAGGRAIAQRVGAVRLFIDKSQEAWEHSSGVAHQHAAPAPVRYSARHIAVRDERDFPAVYRRYYEFAQQMAIASGLSMPILYVLPNEQGINGFVAGRLPQDMVMVVTQGALDKLSDEALYGLIGHEYGHILHGDATFNLQLMVVLAGLQLLYDWSDSINNFGMAPQHQSNHYFDTMLNQNMPVAQKVVDSRARHTEAQTANFTTHSEWVSYWQQQSQAKSKSASPSSLTAQFMLPSARATERNVPRSLWTLLLHGISFSSMASAQLIKHSFNRERELLADATSVQLTRSPAIVETLKAIHQDSLGSRLSDTANINGLSHFFFASSGADLGDVSWFATHPSLSARMRAIDANEYHSFAVQVAKQKRLNAKKINEIYEQRRRGDWNPYKENSLSDNLAKNALLAKASLLTDNIPHANKRAVDTQDSVKTTIINNRDEGLEFTVAEDVVIDGRLQVAAETIGKCTLLKPQQAPNHPDLPTDTLISATDINQLSLPHYILNHSHHPLGAQAVIEALMLCHQCQPLISSFAYDLADIWSVLSDSHTGINNDNNINIDVNNENKVNVNNAQNPVPQKILAHTIDYELLTLVAHLDRRLDSALLALSFKRLSQHDLSENRLHALQQKSLSTHHLSDEQHYKQQRKARHMLLRYQQGLLELIERQLAADLTVHVARIMGHSDNEGLDNDASDNGISNPKSPDILALWQALHLQQLLPILAKVLTGNTDTQTLAAPYLSVLQPSMPAIIRQLDPSGQIFVGLNNGARTMLIIFAYRLAQHHYPRLPQNATSNTPQSDRVVDLRRHARLINIDLTAVSAANLQWLLLTAQSLNSIQLLALINAVNAIEKTAQSLYNDPPESDYRLWLSTLHTVMLHDTIITQQEYDCLVIIAEQWLGVRQLFD